jgi:hypothetical protein
MVHPTSQVHTAVHTDSNKRAVPDFRRLVLSLYLPQRRPHFIDALQELVRELLLLALLQPGDLDFNLSDGLVSALACATTGNV